MATCAVTPPELTTATRDFYCDIMGRLRQRGVPFLIGGTYAMERYTSVPRRTKDLDLFLLKEDFPRVVESAEQAGYRAELKSPHWLGKIYHDADFIDLIFGSGNKVCNVDAGWFEHAVEETVLGTPVLLCPPEETIWSKSFIMERERFDGADVNHLLRARGRHLDWDRLVTRFGPHRRLLLAHLILFGFVYPDDRENVPTDVVDALFAQFSNDLPRSNEYCLCQGPLLSRTQYLIDAEEWDYIDPRLQPHGTMTREQVRQWTDAGR